MALSTAGDVLISREDAYTSTATYYKATLNSISKSNTSLSFVVKLVITIGSSTSLGSGNPRTAYIYSSDGTLLGSKQIKNSTDTWASSKSYTYTVSCKATVKATSGTLSNCYIRIKYSETSNYNSTNSCYWNGSCKYASGEVGNTFNISYDTSYRTLTVKNGNTNLISSVSGGGNKIIGNTVTVKATLKSLDGYSVKFNKWTSSNTSILGNSSSISYKFTMPEKDVTLTASATSTAYILTIIYNANEGKQSSNATYILPYEQKIRYGNTVNLIDNTKFKLSKTGYSRKSGEEWNKNKKGTSTSYNQNTSYSVTDFTSSIKTSNSSINLYAQYTPNEYIITFNPNEGTVTTESKYVTYDSTYGDLPIPIRLGYKFLGWYTSKDDGIKIESDTKVTILDSQTLYALWEPAGMFRLWTSTEYVSALPYIWVNNELKQTIPYIYTNGEWKMGV